MLFSLDRDKSLPGITGMVNETDIVRFVPTSMGETTAGTFELYFDGSDVGLDTTGEDIDALSRTPDGRLVVSMVATYAVPGLAGDDEDLLVFNATSLGENTTGTWELYLDGSDVGLADAADEDIHGTWIDPATGYIYLTTYKYFTTADGLSGDQDDIFVCEPITLGETSACTFHAFWDGDGHGFSDAYITGIHITGLQGGTGVAEVPVIDPIANGDGDGSYTISWNAVADTLTYQLEEAPNGADGFWHTLQDAAQTSHAANAPAAGLWCYRVRATYSNRAGDWSLPVCLTTTVGGAAQPLLAQSGPTILYYSKFGQNDIIALDLATDQTTVYFNGLDVGLFIPDINAFHLEADGSILLSLDREIAVPGIAGAVDDSDVLRFVPVTLGATTIGTFEMLLDGSDVGLDGSLDDVVAIGRAPDGRLVISTKGYYDYNIAPWPLDQVLVFNATSLGENTSGSFETYFASGAVNLNDSADENVHGLWIDGPAGELYLINRFTYSLPNGLSGDNNDILRCTVESLGETTSCSSISLFWDGDAHGVGGGLDAIAFSKPRPAPGTVTGQLFLDADYNGQRDAGDTPWANVPVTLWTKVGAAASTTTDASGLYSFPAYPGRYEIGVTAQSGYQFAPQDVGDDATDSDVGPNGRSATYVLTSTQVITIDAGLGIPPTPTPTNTPTATPTQPGSPLPTATQPGSPLPTPTLPVEIPDIAVHILQDSDFETPLSEAEKQAIWSRGDPVPSTASEIDLVPVAMLSAKSGLMSLAPVLQQQSSDPGWVSIYHENFDSGFPVHNQQYGDCHLELRSTDVNNYNWGGDNFRTYENSAGAAWPAKGGGLGVSLTPGTDTYPDGVRTQIICRFSNLNTTTLKNIMVEFALWLDEADTDDTFFVGFNTGEPLYYDKRWKKTPVDNDGNTLWNRYRFYYPDIAAKVAANNGSLAIMWQFESDNNRRADAKGAWLDDITVERLIQSAASMGCENLANNSVTSIQVQDAPGNGIVSKGLNLGAYVDGDYDLNVKMARLQATETDWVRLEFTLQPSAFIHLRDNTTIEETIDLKHFDQLIDSLCAANIAVLGLIDYTSVADKSWEETKTISPAYLAQFKRTTEMLVNYYDDRIKAWEIWNEPDATATGLNATEYTKLLVEVSPIIHAVNDLMVFGGFVSADIGARDYLQAVYTALRDNHGSVATPFDVFAVHPYPSRDYVDEQGKYLLDPFVAWQVPEEPPNIFRKFQDVLLGFNDLTRNNSNKEIWVTEFGWNAAKGSQQDQQDACLAAEEVWVTLDQQARYLATGFDIMFKETAWPSENRQSITKAFWYAYNDTGVNLSSIGDCVEWPDRASYSWYLTYLYTQIFGPGPEETTEVPWNFGLYHGDWTPKTLTHCAFKAWPFWPDECISSDNMVYLPIIQSDSAVSAAGE